MVDTEKLTRQIQRIMREFDNLSAAVYRPKTDAYGQTDEETALGTAEFWWRSASVGDTVKADHYGNINAADTPRWGVAIAPFEARKDDIAVIGGVRYRIVNAEKHLGRDAWMVVKAGG